MPLTVRLVGENGKLVKFTENGEVVVAPFEYSDPIFQLLDVNDQVYNFFRPKPGEQLIITGITVSANRNVTTQTQVDIYEATSDSSATITKQIRRLDIAKLDKWIEQGIQEEVSRGAFVNAKADDDDALCTISGYYIPALPNSKAVGE